MDDTVLEFAEGVSALIDVVTLVGVVAFTGDAGDEVFDGEPFTGVAITVVVLLTGVDGTDSANFVGVAGIELLVRPGDVVGVEDLLLLISDSVDVVADASILVPLVEFRSGIVAAEAGGVDDVEETRFAADVDDDEVLATFLLLPIEPVEPLLSRCFLSQAVIKDGSRIFSTGSQVLSFDEYPFHFMRYWVTPLTFRLFLISSAV